MISIFGYGSLISEEWAKESCPSLKNFRIVQTKNTIRVFGKVNPQTLYRLDGNWDTMEVASCFLDSKENAVTIGCQFNIEDREWPAIKEREFDYNERKIKTYSSLGEEIGTATTFFGLKSDKKIGGNNQETKEYWKRIRQHYSGEIYRNDILPDRKYLIRCLTAFKKNGKDAYNNFLDHSYLADRKTTIRQYISQQSFFTL